MERIIKSPVSTPKTTTPTNKGKASMTLGGQSDHISLPSHHQAVVTPSSCENSVFKFSSSETDSAASTMGMPAKILQKKHRNNDSQKRKGISFYVGLDGENHKRSSLAVRHRRTLSLDSSKRDIWQIPKANIQRLEERMENLTVNTSLRDLDTPSVVGIPDGSNEPNRRTSLPDKISVKSNGKDTSHKTARHFAMMKRANFQRKRLLEIKRLRLQVTNESNSQLGQLKKQKDFLVNLALKARIEIGLESASIRRQINIERQVEKSKMEVERAQGIAMLNKIEKVVGTFGVMKRSLSEGGLLKHSDEENDSPKSPSIYSKPTSPLRENNLSPGALQIKTKLAYPTTASTPSPTACSPAALELKRNLDSKNVNSPLIAEPPTMLKAKRDMIEHASPVERAVRQEMISKITSKLKRSQSAPVLTISIKSLISQLQLGVILGAPFKITDMLPPINHYTLRELDFDEIINNIQLRHDLLFDSNLQFKPNDDGEKGSEREQKTNAFWEKVEMDLQKVLNHSKTTAQSATIEKITTSSERSIHDYLARPYFLTVPVLINEIKEIMLELLPYSTAFHEELNDLFDVDHLSRQMEIGSFNPIPLIEYMGKTLKTHCAPVRDDIIDQMVDVCKKGDFVKTLRMCFNILELMKLDIANHQLRRIRPHVIDHAIEYEWSYFQEQIRLNLITLEKTESWVKNCIQSGDIFGTTKSLNGEISRSQSQTNLQKSASATSLTGSETGNVGKGKFTDLYYKSLLMLIMQFKKDEVPETFSLDLTRLTSLHNEWQDITILACLLVLYKQSLGPKATFNEMKTMKDQLWVLLNDSETTLPHINLHLVSNAEKVRGTAFSENERKALSTLIDKTLSPESPLYDLIQKRIGIQLYGFLDSGSLIKDLLGKHSLLELESEIDSLAKKIKPFAEHNRLVYASVYNELIKKH